MAAVVSGSLQSGPARVSQERIWRLIGSKVKATSAAATQVNPSWARGATGTMALISTTTTT